MTAPPLLLDGATGTELIRRGATIDGVRASAAIADTHPAWLTAIAREYAEAGAQILTAHTLCTHVDPEAADRRTAAAIACVRAATVIDPRIRVAGSLGPLDPGAADPDARGQRYLDHARRLAAGCDVVLVETMTGPDEAALALEAVRTAGAPRVWLSLVAGPGARWIGGASLRTLPRDVDLSGVDAVLVNCTAAAALPAALGAIAEVVDADVWRGVYPSLDPKAGSERSLAQTVAGLAETFGLDVVGGCCGTTPGFIAELRRRLHAGPAREAAWRRLPD